MYRIIGGDGREYGPVTAEQLRQWIADGRATAHTKVQTEGSTEWKTLTDLPEFADSVGSSSGVPPKVTPSATAAPASAKLTGADKKIVAGVCGILLGSFGVHKFILGYTGEGLTMLLVTLLTCGIAACVTGLIGLIEGIVYLTKSDDDFVRTYVQNKRGWF